MKDRACIGVAVLVLAVAAFAVGCGAKAGHEMHMGGHEGMTMSANKAGEAQTVCPAMGGKIDKDLFVDHDGKRMYLCCKMCLAKVKEDPAKYIKKLEAEGVILDKTPGAGDEK